jgi:hypothetical protein
LTCFFILIEIPIIFLNFLGGPFNSWIVEIRNLIRDDWGYQSLIGIFHGAVAAFVAILGVKIAKRGEFNDNIKSYLRSMMAVVSFFSVIVALGMFSAEIPFLLHGRLDQHYL